MCIDSVLEFAGAVFVSPTQTVRWCLKSAQEAEKCKRLEMGEPRISCVRRESTLDCIVAIKVTTTSGINVNVSFFLFLFFS